MKKTLMNIKFLALAVMIVSLTSTSYGQGASFIFPQRVDNQKRTFYRVLMPPTNESKSKDNLITTDPYFMGFPEAERLLKQANIKVDTVYTLSYVVDSKRQYVVALYLYAGHWSRGYYKLKYGDLPYSDSLPTTATEFCDRFPNLEYIYSTSSPYKGKREKVIIEDIEPKSIEDLKGDTSAYFKHFFRHSEVFYFYQPFTQLIKDLVKPKDYRIIKNGDNLVFGVVLKYIDDEYVFIFLKNGKVDERENIPLSQVKGEIVMISRFNVPKEVARVEKGLKTHGIDFPENRALVKKFFML